MSCCKHLLLVPFCDLPSHKGWPNVRIALWINQSIKPMYLSEGAPEYLWTLLGMGQIHVSAANRSRRLPSIGAIPIALQFWLDLSLAHMDLVSHVRFELLPDNNAKKKKKKKNKNTERTEQRGQHTETSIH